MNVSFSLPSQKTNFKARIVDIPGTESTIVNSIAKYYKKYSPEYRYGLIENVKKEAQKDYNNFKSVFENWTNCIEDTVVFQKHTSDSIKCFVVADPQVSPRNELFIMYPSAFIARNKIMDRKVPYGDGVATLISALSVFYSKTKGFGNQNPYAVALGKLMKEIYA